MPRERGQYHQIQIERTMSITVATFSEILTYDMLLAVRNTTDASLLCTLEIKQLYRL